jgi:hypothetical protein
MAKAHRGNGWDVFTLDAAVVIHKNAHLKLPFAPINHRCLARAAWKRSSEILFLPQGNRISLDFLSMKHTLCFWGLTA